MADRSKDWLRQAERDLRQAEISKGEEIHEWACFAAQQSAEKAVKALHLSEGQEAWGDVVRKLLEELPLEVPHTLIERAQVLDTFYIPARYPNGHADGAAFEHFGALQSTEAINHAREIIGFVRSRMAEKE
jgi:HEPN domain-containing protein